MSTRIHTHRTYTLEYYEREHDTEHVFELPFDPEGEPEHVYISANGLHAVLAFLVPDDSPEDPFDTGIEGEFYQFDSRSIHYCERPGIDKFKRIIRENPGLVFTHDGTGNCHGPGTVSCRITGGPFTAHDTIDKRIKHPGTGSKLKEKHTGYAEKCLDDCYGYYIAPADVTDPTSYAAGTLETYSQWCNGEVYGVVVWEYTRASIADDWTDPDRDQECWGFYGQDSYTADELHACFIHAVTHGDPSQEATTL